MRSLKEFFTGTQQEKTAKERLSQLKGPAKLTQTQRDELETATGITRRLFIRQAAIAGVSAFAFAACVEVTRKTVSPVENEISRYYPELGIPIAEKGSFRTKNNNRSVNWYNFTESRFDEKAANELYSYFEGIAGNNLNGKLTTRAGRTISYTIEPHVSVDLKLFIVPGLARNPKWAQHDTEGGSTFIDDPHDINLTVIKLQNPALSPSRLKMLLVGPVENANYSLVIEAAQSTLLGQSSSFEEAFYAQEVFNNSLAFALFAVQSHFTYEQYANFVRDSEFRYSIGTIPMILFTNVQYAQIPSLPPVLYKR